MRSALIIAVSTMLLAIAINAMNIKNTKKWRALVLEGGGDKGSYEVGVLKALTEFLPPEEVMYDVVTGVSVGSINAMGIALHKIGEEKKAVEWMNTLWSNLNASNIYVSWPYGMIEGIFYREGLWNNQPEFDYLSARFKEFKDQKVFRKVNINTWDFDTGEVYKYNETSPADTLTAAVVASTSMPFAFTHTHLDGHTFVDGGSVWNIDLSGAIERWKEIVDDEEDIIIDTILCSGAQNITRDEHKSYNTVSNYMRYKEITTFYNSLSDYEEIKRGYPKVNFRFNIVPETPLPSGYIPLGFKKDDILKMINIGYEDGKDAVNKGSEFSQKRTSELLMKYVYQGVNII